MIRWYHHIVLVSLLLVDSCQSFHQPRLLALKSSQSPRCPLLPTKFVMAATSASGSGSNTVIDASSSSTNSKVQYYVGKSAKYIVSGLAFMLLLLNESWVPKYFVMGGVANSFLSKFIKVIIKQPRPVASPKLGYGMPSSHAQSLIYFATVLSLSLQAEYFSLYPIGMLVSSSFIWAYAILAWYAMLPTYVPPPLPPIVFLTCPFFTPNFSSPFFQLIFSFHPFNSSWRVQSKLHTVMQTGVGATLGLALGNFVFYLKPNVQPFLQEYLQPPPDQKNLIMLTKVSIAFAGFVVIYIREIKAFLKKISEKTI